MKTAPPNPSLRVRHHAVASTLGVKRSNLGFISRLPRVITLAMTIILSSILFLFFTTPTFAQTTSPYASTNTNPDVPKNLHTLTQNVLVEVMAAVVCQLTGVDPVNPKQECLGVDQTTGKIGFVKNGGGAVGFMGNMVTALYTPPLHTSDYFQYLSQNFGIAKPAYAQGVGFTGLQPLTNLWIAFRNIVYLLFVLVFVVIGLAIMLRIKIDPRTVMSIENQIPKIIVSIVLVTFSFAIGGFLIDIMYVSTYVVINVLHQADPNGIKVAPITKELSSHPIGFANTALSTEGNGKPSMGGVLDIVNRSAASVSDLMHSHVFPPKDVVNILNPPKDCGFLSFNCWENIIGDTLSQIAGWTISFIVGILATLIIAIAILVALFRLWIALLTAYIYILLDVVIAPFYIVLGLFPGSPLGFGAWFRDMLANLSVFPVSVTMFLLGKIFMDQFDNVGPAAQQFVPPLIGASTDFRTISALIGLGIILITPQVLTMMRDYLKAPQFKYSAGIGQALSAGAGVPGRTVSGVGNLLLGTQYDPEHGLVGKGGAIGRFARAFGFAH